MPRWRLISISMVLESDDSSTAVYMDESRTEERQPDAAGRRAQALALLSQILASEILSVEFKQRIIAAIDPELISDVVMSRSREVCRDS